MAVRQEHQGQWTHVEWTIDGVTPRMLDWYWTNLDKGFALAHPTEHSSFFWAVRPRHGQAVGAVYAARQRWADDVEMEAHVRYEDVASLPPDVAQCVRDDHAVAGAILAFSGREYKLTNPIIAYRIHQYHATDEGVRGLSSAITVRPHPLEEGRGLTWAAHTEEEFRHLGSVLPILHRLWASVVDTDVNPFFRFAVTPTEHGLRYVERLASHQPTATATEVLVLRRR